MRLPILTARPRQATHTTVKRGFTSDFSLFSPVWLAKDGQLHVEHHTGNEHCFCICHDRLLLNECANWVKSRSLLAPPIGGGPSPSVVRSVAKKQDYRSLDSLHTNRNPVRHWRLNAAVGS